MDKFSLFDINFQSLNLLSFMLGMFFAGTMYRSRALAYVAFYFCGVALYYFIKMQTQ